MFFGSTYQKLTKKDFFNVFTFSFVVLEYNHKKWGEPGLVNMTCCVRKALKGTTSLTELLLLSVTSFSLCSWLFGWPCFKPLMSKWRRLFLPNIFIWDFFKYDERRWKVQHISHSYVATVNMATIWLYEENLIL